MRPVPELRAFGTLHNLWDVWDKGSQHQPALRVLEEEHGSKWRRMCQAPRRTATPRDGSSALSTHDMNQVKCAFAIRPLAGGTIIC